MQTINLQWILITFVSNGPKYVGKGWIGLSEHGLRGLFERKGVEWDGDNVEYMWEQVKWAFVDSERELCGSMRVGGKNPKYMLE